MDECVCRVAAIRTRGYAWWNPSHIETSIPNHTGCHWIIRSNANAFRCQEAFRAAGLRTAAILYHFLEKNRFGGRIPRGVFLTIGWCIVEGKYRRIWRQQTGLPGHRETLTVRDLSSVDYLFGKAIPFTYAFANCTWAPEERRLLDVSAARGLDYEKVEKASPKDQMGPQI
ncbi:hypothetical protein CPB84DRAFT_1744668 [Gymnopilus junonius]|uniref:Uncharacterized protein n=1 Tax=Gymnopilus junonius TaxID=109634 RepID=A0A9P5NWX7_GYMJU|nr:hypothetical protein CPB84DRAFT_1744668 [Gymnopilus junonius]